MWVDLRSLWEQKPKPVNYRYQFGTHDQATRDAQIAASQRVFPAVQYSLQPLPPFIFALQDATPWDVQLASSSAVFSTVAAETVAPTLLARFVFAGLPDELQRDLQIAASSIVFVVPATPAPPVPPPVVPAVAGGTVPGFVAGKKKRKDAGPYMREDQVFGEEYPPSPFLGQKRDTPEPEQPRRKGKGLKLADSSHHEIILALMKELL